MFFHKKSHPKCEKKVAYADLTGSGKGILAKNVYGAVVRDNKLVSSHGLNFFYYLDEPIEAIMKDTDGDFFCFTKEAVYLCDINRYTSTFLMRGHWPRPVSCYHPYAKSLVISSGQFTTFGYKSDHKYKVFDILDEEGFSALAYFCDRCFGIRDGNVLRFTDRGDVNHWTQTLTLPQKAVALAATDDGLYVIGQDVYLFKFDDNQINSKLTLVYKGIGQVAQQSAQSYGKGFLFFGDGCVQYFNGHSVKKIAQLCPGTFANNRVTSCVCNGMYYVAYSADDSGQNTHLALVNLADMRVQTVYDLCVTHLFTDGQAVWFVSDGQVAELCDWDVPNVVWESRPYNFGSDFTKKSLQQVFVKADCTGAITVTTERETRIINLDRSKKLQKIPLRGSFYSLRLKFETDDYVEVECLGIVAQEIKEDN